MLLLSNTLRSFEVDLDVFFIFYSASENKHIYYSDEPALIISHFYLYYIIENILPYFW